MKKSGLLGLTLLSGFGFVVSSSCAAKREVTIELLEGCTGVRAAADYVQFVVFPNRCPTDEELAAGQTTGARFQTTVAATAELPSIGDLPKSKFGFAAILRDEKCTVTGFGCTVADLETIGGVRISVCDWSDKSGPEAACACQPLKGGGCMPPEQCVEGTCKKLGVDEGGACSLVVEAAGKLPSPPAPTARLTGPAIAATDNGFVLGYRDQDGATLRVLVMYLNDAGTLSQPAVFDLGGCASKEPTDGVGIAYEGGYGLFATSLPDCGAGAGAMFVPFDAQGVVTNATGPRNATFLELTMAPQGGVAPAATNNEFELLYRVSTNGAPNPVIERVVMQGPGFKNIPIVHPFGEDDRPFGMVATSPKVRAFLVAEPSGSDGSAPGTKVLVGDRMSDTISIKGEFDLPLAAWATMTAWNNHVAAAVPASTGLTLSVADLSGSTVAVSATGLVGTGSTQGGALATLRNHLFLAQGYSGGIKIYRLPGAETKVSITPADAVELPAAVGPVNLGAFSGQQIAMAAARNKVAVVWLNKPKLAMGDLTGGWALLRCAE